MILDSPVLRFGRMSIRLAPRSLWVCLWLGLVTCLVSMWSLGAGDFPIPPREVVQYLAGNGTDEAGYIIGHLRLPRILTGLLVGAAFGMAGAIFQSLSQNPLGSPDIVGFDSGSALGAVVMIVVVGGSNTLVAAGALAGGLCTAGIVYVLAWNHGLRAGRLILVGIGFGFTAKAAVDFLILRAAVYDVKRAAVWLTGSLNGRSWGHVWTILVALAVLTPFAVRCQYWLDRLELGDDSAVSLGIDIGKVKLGTVLVGVSLAALAVAAAGPVGFVSFVSGPIARRLTRSPGAAVLPAALVGSLVVVSADLIARRALAPTELPVGITTSMIGAPYLLWLLLSQAKKGEL